MIEMMWRATLVLAGLVYVATVVGAVLTPPGGPAGGPAAEPSPPVQALRPAPHRPVVGFAISFHHTDDLPSFLKVVDELAALGVNSVQVVTPAFQKDGASQDIEVVPGESARRADLIKLLQYAKAKGMTTALMPIVLFSEPRGNEWRGKINPQDWDVWWASYRRMQDYFLDIANKAHVDDYAVGSELLSTEKETRRWVSLITHVRRHFHGRLYYSTNWDHYQVPTFWKYLDMIGISCYWDMTTYADTDPPSARALAQRWAEIRKDVLEFAAQEDRPVVFTELGYPSLPWGLKDPWNYVDTKGVKSAPEVQLLGYQAFLDAWGDLLMRRATAAGRADGFAGVYFYSWQPWDKGGPGDIGYGIKGKPASRLLANWLKKWRVAMGR